MFERDRPRFSWLLAVFVLCLFISHIARAQEARPTMRDFMGLCVHTVLFEAEAYTPIARLVRDYHGVNWDLEDETDYVPQWPMARNGVNWDQLYGGWTETGYEVLVSLMFDATPPAIWSDLEGEAQAYGQSFAAYFGAGGQGTVSAVEIGNEPTQWDDAQYRTLFESAATGVRAGDPTMPIATCAAKAGPSDTYAKSLDTLAGLESLYDIINVHAYAFVEGWPTWRRSYPEDPSIAFLREIQDVVDWRDQNAVGKEIWITEFGWDSSTQEPDPDSDFARWEDVSDLQQAQYIVRTFLIFAAMDIDRAYLYWFNDEDQPQLHGSSGLTREGEPKASFHAVAHLYESLGELRLDRVIRADPGEAYVYAFVDPADADRALWVAWSPTGEDRRGSITLARDGWRVERAEHMPTVAGPGPSVDFVGSGEGDANLSFDVSESPVYLWMIRDLDEPDPGTEPQEPDGTNQGGTHAESDPPISPVAGPRGGGDSNEVDRASGEGGAGSSGAGKAPLGAGARRQADRGGCACTTASTHSTFPLALLLAGWFLGRRRSFRIGPRER